MPCVVSQRTETLISSIIAEQSIRSLAKGFLWSIWENLNKEIHFWDRKHIIRVSGLYFLYMKSIIYGLAKVSMKYFENFNGLIHFQERKHNLTVFGLYFLHIKLII